MERFASRAAAAGDPDEAPGIGPAARDAGAILARAAADAAAADDARQRYLTEPSMPALEPDARISPLLASHERVLAVRRNAVVERRQSRRPDAPLGVAGALYVTSLRVVLVGRVVLSLALSDIEEMGVAAERLILILGGGSSMSVETAQPRLLRVQIAAARGQARA